MRPKTFSSHTTTTIMTTAFRIDLMEPAIGMKLLTSQRSTPTTTRAIKICTKGVCAIPIKPNLRLFRLKCLYFRSPLYVVEDRLRFLDHGASDVVSQGERKSQTLGLGSCDLTADFISSEPNPQLGLIVGQV